MRKDGEVSLNFLHCQKLLASTGKGKSANISSGNDSHHEPPDCSCCPERKHVQKTKKKFRSWIQTRLSCCDFRSGCASSALIRDRLRFLADPAADKSPLMSAHLPKAALIVAPLRDYKWKREMLGAPSPKQGEKGGKTHLPACCVQGQLVI